MKTSLTYLPPARRKQLQTITRIITEAIHPEKIILFGIFGSKIGRPDFYASSQLPAFVCSYDILVIMRKEYRRQVYEVQDLVENLCRIETPVTVLVHDIEYVNNRLSEGHYFFSMLYKEAVLLYDACTVPLVEGLPPDLPKLKILAQNDFDRLMGQPKIPTRPFSGLLLGISLGPTTWINCGGIPIVSRSSSLFYFPVIRKERTGFSSCYSRGIAMPGIRKTI